MAMVSRVMPMHMASHAFAIIAIVMDVTVSSGLLLQYGMAFCLRGEHRAWGMACDSLTSGKLHSKGEQAQQQAQECLT